MKVSVHVEGLRELQKALSELPKATATNVVRKALEDAAAPVAAAAKALAPVASGELRSSVIAGTKLSRRQKKVHRQWAGTTPVKTPAGWRNQPAKEVFVFAGAGTNPHAHLQEFGTADLPPQPFMRPAWDANK
jgi:HK97 gp10 family phage protein